MVRKIFFILTVMLTVVIFVSLVSAEGKRTGSKKRSDILYVCNCGDDCKCNTVSTMPGKCTCDTKLVPMHVLKIEGSEAVLCRCGKGCTCKIDPNDPTKCGCGKPVKRVDIKGMYVCNCGPDCNCNTISDKPGKCKCGVDLKKVE